MDLMERIKSIEKHYKALTITPDEMLDDWSVWLEDEHIDVDTEAPSISGANMNWDPQDINFNIDSNAEPLGEYYLIPKEEREKINKVIPKLRENKPFIIRKFENETI